MSEAIEVSQVEDNDTVAARLDRIENGVTEILTIMQNVEAHISGVGELIDELQDSPIGNMLFGMMGGK